MMDGYGMHGWVIGWWCIIGILIIVASVWMGAKTMNKNSTINSSAGKSPLDIMNERYARGEIDKEEFEERKKDLM